MDDKITYPNLTKKSTFNFLRFKAKSLFRVDTEQRFSGPKRMDGRRRSINIFT